MVCIASHGIHVPIHWLLPTLLLAGLGETCVGRLLG